MADATSFPFLTVSGIEYRFLTTQPGAETNHLYLADAAESLARIATVGLERRERDGHRSGRPLGNQVQWLGGRVGDRWRLENVGAFGSNVTAGQAISNALRDVPGLLDRDAAVHSAAVAEALAGALPHNGGGPATLVIALVAPKTQLPPPRDLPGARVRLIIFNDWQDLVVNQSLLAPGNGLFGQGWWRELAGRGPLPGAYYDVSFNDRPFSHGLGVCSGAQLRPPRHGKLLSHPPVDVAETIAAAFLDAGGRGVGVIAHSQGANIVMHALHRLKSSQPRL
ncbi:MAG: hypothetical protein BIFFINMI_00991 [Phycisphaerae bacterium]|nr:hypothetical protein [Phycisphaerae bacterium]